MQKWLRERAKIVRYMYVHIYRDFRRVRKIAKMPLLASSGQSVCLSAWNNSAPTGQIFMKFDIEVLFEKNCLEHVSCI